MQEDESYLWPGAEAGVRVRLCLGDPDGASLAARDAEYRIGGGLVLTSAATACAGLADDQAQAAYGVLTSGRAIDILAGAAWPGPPGRGRRHR